MNPLALVQTWQKQFVYNNSSPVPDVHPKIDVKNYLALWLVRGFIIRQLQAT
jgi:hypothetical protein